MSLLLQARDVSKHFVQRTDLLSRMTGRGRNPVRVVKAVDRVSFDLHVGEIFGLLGQSGSGKTTLVRTLLRLTRPTSGHILFQNQDVGALSDDDVQHHLRRKARMIFQHPDAALNPAFTVERVLDQALKAHTSLSPSERRGRSIALLEDVGLPASYLGKYPHELSGGEKRRVSISRALATEPALLVADEPVSGLDVSLQGQILDLLVRLREEHRVTLLLISHDIGLIRKLCDRIGVMYAGRLVEIGARAEIAPETCRHPYTRALFEAHLTLDSQLSPATGAPIDADQAPLAATTSGCPYRLSCARWHALDQPNRCLQADPEPILIQDGHWAACHFAT